MKHRLISLLLILPLVGCRSAEVFLWSPDGSRLAILGEDEIYITKGDDAPPLNFKLPKNSELLVAKWLPDSQRMLVSAARTTTDWKDIEKVLSPLERSQWQWAVTQVKAELESFRSRHPEIGERDEPSPTLNALNGVGRYLVAKYLAAHEPDQLAPDKVGDRWHQWLTAIDLFPIFSLEIWSITNDSITIERTLHQGINPRIISSISPNGRYACVLETNHFVGESLLIKSLSQSFDLWIYPLASENEKPQLVALEATTNPGRFYCDWSPDDQYIAFTKSSYPNDDSNARLVVVDVMAVDGTIRPNLEIEPFVELDQATASVHFISDDRLLFPAGVPSYPRLINQYRTPFGFYALKRRPEPQLAKMPLTSSVPDRYADALAKGTYALSPQRDKAAIVSPDGVVLLQDLATGAVQVLQPTPTKPDDTRGCLWFAQPSWRTNDELSFAVPPGSKHGSPTRPEIVLWNETGVRCLSNDWPDAMLRRLILDVYKKKP